MNGFLLKHLALALTASQIVTNPQSLQTHFADNAEVSVRQILQAGCNHALTVLASDVPAFAHVDVEGILQTFSQNAQTFHQEGSVIGGLNIDDLRSAYREICKGESPPHSPIDFHELIAFYNQTLDNLPDARTLVGKRLPQVSSILGDRGRPYAEAYEENNRRVWVPIGKIPDMVRKAFIAAEDKRFFSHHGVDEHGLIRAAVQDVIGGRSREEGGSTITQQVVKNLLVGSAPTIERKMREMVVATRLEQAMNKEQILELYLNLIYFGRSAWGVETAAQAYFGKSVSNLSVTEAAFLAGLPKGPTYYDPDRNPQRSEDRTQYVLAQMHDDGFLPTDQFQTATAVVHGLSLRSVEHAAKGGGRYFVDELERQVRHDTDLDPRRDGLTIRSTIDPYLQSAAESSVQEGLAQYELASGRARFSGPEMNLSGTVAKGEPWLSALQKAHMPLYDVHWSPGIVLNTKPVTVGLTDGRILPLHAWSSALLKTLQQDDVVWVRASPGKAARADLRFRPHVQGAALVVKNSTGEVLAMVGGFSYPLSQLNRAVHMVRQPGSTVKPVTYLVALQSGLQPNTMVLDAPVELPPLESGGQPWAPNDFVRSDTTTVTTLSKGLENSLNRVTAGLLTAIDTSPAAALDKVRALMRECGVAADPPRFFPIVIGALDVSMMNLATCFATIARGGQRPHLHLVDAVDKDGHSVDLPANTDAPVNGADAISFFQVRTLMQGVLARGTAKPIDDSLKSLAGPGGDLSQEVAVKTGTSQNSRDDWFAALTSDVTIVIWVGYDKPRQTLGDRATGASVGGLIFAPLLRAIANVYPLKPLPMPPADLTNQVAPVAVEEATGRPVQLPAGSPLPAGVVVDYLRLSSVGQPFDTWQSLLAYDPSRPVYSQQAEPPWNWPTPGQQWDGWSPWGQGQW